MKSILNQQSIHFGLGLVHSRVRLQEQMHVGPQAYSLTKTDSGELRLGDEVINHPICVAHDVPKGKKQIITEQWKSADVHAQIDIRVGSGSTLHYIILPTKKQVLNQMHSIDRRIHVAKDATLIVTELSAEAHDRVSQTQVTLVARGAEAKLKTAFIGKQQQNHHLIHHVHMAAGYTKASIDSYGLLQDKSRGIYRAQIEIEKGAAQAIAAQSAHVLLDGEKVRVDAVPELDVSHNLVQCGHGVAIAQLDDEALFYAQSRGLSESEAKRVLKKAHMERVLGHVPKGEQKKVLQKIIDESLF